MNSICAVEIAENAVNPNPPALTRGGIIGMEGAMMIMQDNNIYITRVKSWDPMEITALYVTGGWLGRGPDPDPDSIRRIISGSYIFIVAVDRSTGETVGMGRVISDGISDAYIQDLIVKPSYRDRGIGSAIVERAVEYCFDHGVNWIGLVAAPGTAEFYQTAGFLQMEGYIPMLYGGRNDAFVK